MKKMEAFAWLFTIGLWSGLTVIIATVVVLLTIDAFADSRIVYTRPDGGVSIVSPAPEFMAQFATEAEGLAAVQEQAVPPTAMNVRVIDSADVPPSREFRNAWRHSPGPGFTVDMTAAREIHAEHIAAAQARAIERLLRAERRGRVRGRADQANADKAQRLRIEALNLSSIAAQIAAAADVAELKVIWPTDLADDRR